MARDPKKRAQTALEELKRYQAERKKLAFMSSDDGALARYSARRRRRISLIIEDIEPQSKNMPEIDRDKFQVAVAKELKVFRRNAFRGAIALKIDLSTAAKDPAHVHTITKNLLDLLSVKRKSVDFPRQHLLYLDDRQIQALSVSCRHGEERPMIFIEARPFRGFVADLELATRADRSLNHEYDRLHEEEQSERWIDDVRDMTKNEAARRKSLGDDLYEASLRSSRFYAQRALLLRSALDVHSLGWMYGVPEGFFADQHKGMWAQITKRSTLRLQVGELPVAEGDSAKFKISVHAAIKYFKTRLDWLIQPLVVPVALEVVVRPNPKTPPNVLHDLDNIVRRYLLPGIVPSFGTVSDHRFTMDLEAMKKYDPDFDKRIPIDLPPKGTKAGVTRYEVWRLPPVEGEDGFVSVALVSDVDFKGGLMDQVDDSILKWSKQRKKEKERERRR